MLSPVFNDKQISLSFLTDTSSSRGLWVSQNFALRGPTVREEVEVILG